MPDRRWIPLWPDGCPHNDAPDRQMESGRAALLHYRAPFRRKADLPRAAVIVCPGGGYTFRACHEGEPLATLFNQYGIDAFVLDYRVSPQWFPASYSDACRAVRLVRSLAGQCNLDPQRIGLMGFSAGGHLAAAVALQPGLHHDEHDDLASQFAAKPDRVILGYPVITCLPPHAHRTCFRNLVGPEHEDTPRGQQLRRQLSNELHVTPDAPPAFIFHTAGDAEVVCQNSLQLALAYADAGVKCEYHQFEQGPHGEGMALSYPKLRIWTPLLMQWLADWIRPLN